jgi:S-disulfanyl-L-cysteine oxidoreductase SoxD
MFRILLVAVMVVAAGAQTKFPGVGKAASAERVKAADKTVMADGRGLPVGQGSVEEGRGLYKTKCAECHNENGEGRDKQWPALVGGTGTLTAKAPKKTVGSYWPYATTVYDTIARAMPYDQPGTLKPDEVYAITAFVLHLNGIVGAGEKLDQKTLPQVKMPNREGFIPDVHPDVKAKR